MSVHPFPQRPAGEGGCPVRVEHGGIQLATLFDVPASSQAAVSAYMRAVLEAMHDSHHQGSGDAFRALAELVESAQR